MLIGLVTFAAGLIGAGIARPLGIHLLRGGRSARFRRRLASASTFRLAREIQRIEQGMGRGVRDTGDYCAVLLLGASLGVATHDPRHLNLFSPATRAHPSEWQLSCRFSCDGGVNGASCPPLSVHSGSASSAAWPA